MKNAKKIAIVPQNAIVKKHKPIVIKIAKKIVQKNVNAKNTNVIVKRKNVNAVAVKNATAQKKTVLADVKTVKNVPVNAVKIVIAITENAAKRKNVNAVAVKNATAQKKTVLADVKTVKNVLVNAVKIVLAITENAAKRKNLNFSRKNAIAKKIVKKKQIVKKPIATVKNRFNYKKAANRQPF